MGSDKVKIDNITDDNSFPLKRKFNYNYLWPILFSWVLLYALKGTTGTDAGAYWKEFKILYYSSQATLSHYIFAARDRLFQALFWILSKTFHGYWIPACAVFALLLYYPIIYIIREKSVDPGFSCLMYIFTMSIYFGYNGLRQGLSMGFVALAYYCFLCEKRYWWYLALMLVAYGFHSASVLIIPLHLIMLQKVNSVRGAIIIFGLVIFYIFMVELWGSVINVLDTLGQEKMVHDYGVIKEKYTDKGSYLRIMVSSAVLLLSVINYKRLKTFFSDFDMDFWVIVLSVFSTCLIKKFVYFGRLGAYTNIGLFLVFPKLTYAFGIEKQKETRFFIGCLYFIYMIALLLHGESELFPYKPVWETDKF